MSSEVITGGVKKIQQANDTPFAYPPIIINNKLRWCFRSRMMHYQEKQNFNSIETDILDVTSDCESKVILNDRKQAKDHQAPFYDSLALAIRSKKLVVLNSPCSLDFKASLICCLIFIASSAVKSPFFSVTTWGCSSSLSLPLSESLSASGSCSL